MKVAVIGAGSMGCMLGGYLQLGGADVTLVVRRKELMDALNEKGLTVRMYEDGDSASSLNIPVKAAVDVKDLGVMDALLVMVKGPDTKAAMDSAKILIGDNTKVVTLQNGIGNVDIIKARAKAIYAEDSGKPIRKSHENPDIQKLYREFLGAPLSERSHHLLHTRYFDKSLK